MELSLHAPIDVEQAALESLAIVVDAFAGLIRASASFSEVPNSARSLWDRTGSSSIVVTGTIVVRRRLSLVAALLVMTAL